MKLLKYSYIERVFTDLAKLKQEGIYLSGVRGEGEYKSWNTNGKLFIHQLYKDGKVIKDYLV